MPNIEQIPKDTQLNQKSFLGWLSKMIGVEQDSIMSVQAP